MNDMNSSQFIPLNPTSFSSEELGIAPDDRAIAINKLTAAIPMFHAEHNNYLTNVNLENLCQAAVPGNAGKSQKL